MYFKSIFVALALSVLALSANAWTLTPLSQELPPRERSFQVQIDNTKGQKIVAVRLAVQARDSDEFGVEVLSDTNDLIAFPRQMIVKPGESSAARVSVRKPNTSEVEKSYRLIVEEVPIKSEEETTSIRILGRYLASVYLLPRSKKVEDFEVESAFFDADNITIKVRNGGNHHHVFLPGRFSAGGQDFDMQSSAVNVLPGKTISVDVPLNETAKNNLQSGQKLSIHNICMVCPSGQVYEVVLE